MSPVPSVLAPHLPSPPLEAVLALLDRIPDACLVAFDARGVFTRFGPAAERFFGCSAGEAVGRLHYASFHDPAELEACRDDPAFARAMIDPGWIEGPWRILPRSGAPFAATVTLIALRSAPPPSPDGTDPASAPAPPASAPSTGTALAGWLAFYRRAERP